jgi:hypothetical protein
MASLDLRFFQMSHFRLLDADSRFENWRTCFNAHQEIADIGNSGLTEYTTTPIISGNGNDGWTFEVIGCPFSSRTVQAE